jgi:hypothetical protein
VRTKYYTDFASLVGFLTTFGYQVFGLYEQEPDWDANVLRYCNALFISEKLIARGAKLPNGTKP